MFLFIRVLKILILLKKKIVKNQLKYKKVSIRVMLIKNALTVCIPSHPKIKQIITKNIIKKFRKYILSKNVKYPESKTDIKAKTATEASIAITPANLLGIDRKIA